jgi:hypothetical protein
MGGVVGGAPFGVAKDGIRRVEVAHEGRRVGMGVDIGMEPTHLPAERGLNRHAIGVRRHLQQCVIVRRARGLARFHPVGLAGIPSGPDGTASMRHTFVGRPKSLTPTIGWISKN